MEESQLETSAAAAGANGTLVVVDDEIPATQASDGENVDMEGLQPTTEEVPTTEKGEIGKTEEVPTTGKGEIGKTEGDIDVSSLHDAKVLWLTATIGSICFV